MQFVIWCVVEFCKNDMILKKIINCINQQKHPFSKNVFKFTSPIFIWKWKKKKMLSKAHPNVWSVIFFWTVIFLMGWFVRDILVIEWFIFQITKYEINIFWSIWQKNGTNPFSFQCCKYSVNLKDISWKVIIFMCIGACRNMLHVFLLNLIM